MDKKIYQARPITWLIPILFSLLIAFLVGCCVFLMNQTLRTHDVTAIVPLLGAAGLTFSFAYVALLFFDIPATRIELSDEGVLCYSIGYRLYTPWSNICSVVWTAHSPRFPRFFNLKEPAITTLSLAEGVSNKQAVFEKHWWVPAWLLEPERASARIPVPVVFLSQKEREAGAMHDYLRQYASHLDAAV